MPGFQVTEKTEVHSSVNLGPLLDFKHGQFVNMSDLSRPEATREDQSEEAREAASFLVGHAAVLYPRATAQWQSPRSLLSPLPYCLQNRLRPSLALFQRGGKSEWKRAPQESSSLGIRGKLPGKPIRNSAGSQGCWAQSNWGPEDSLPRLHHQAHTPV